MVVRWSPLVLVLWLRVVTALGLGALRGEFPFALLVERQTSGLVQSCGGVLLAPSWGITACHCVLAAFFEPDTHLSTYQVSAGSVDMALPDVQTRMIESVQCHPRFRAGKRADDLSVLQIESPFHIGQNVHPALMPSKSVWPPRYSEYCVSLMWRSKHPRGDLVEELVLAPVLVSGGGGKACHPALRRVPYSVCGSAPPVRLGYYKGQEMGGSALLCRGRVAVGLSLGMRRNDSASASMAFVYLGAYADFLKRVVPGVQFADFKFSKAEMSSGTWQTNSSPWTLCLCAIVFVIDRWISSAHSYL